MTNPQAKLEELVVSDQYVKWPVTEEDVGGELLSLLSQGLYTNPLDSIREYIQNSVDARASRVIVHFTANSITVSDDGQGMTLDALLEARQFGVSSKDRAQNVGFRGIGIYSGFHLCDGLTITTHTADDPYQFVLRFDFKSMRRELEEERKTKRQTTIPLTHLLGEYSWLRREESTDRRSFTVATLEEIEEAHLSRLADLDSLERYMLQTLPIKFSSEFEHGDDLNQLLEANVPGYNAITIIVRGPSFDERIIQKPAIPNLLRPDYGPIKDTEGRTLAWYWACLHKERAQLPDEFVEYRGFVYKLKGFSIGGRGKLRPVLRRGRASLYDWHTGEIFVVDEDITPTSERHDFEAGPAKDALEAAVRDTLRELERKAEARRVRLLTLDKLAEFKDLVKSTRRDFAAPTRPDLVVLHRKLADAIEDMQDRKSSLRGKELRHAEAVIARAEALRDRIRRDIDRPTPEKARKKAEARKRDVSEEAPPAEEVKPATLMDVFEEANWTLGEGEKEVLRHVQEALEAALGADSSTLAEIVGELRAELEIESS